jgi:hypothetical protein
MMFSSGNSDIRLCRNLIVHQFLKAPYQWLMFIDADICFSADDFRLVFDFPPFDIASSEEITKNNNGEDLIVCAEYARKVDTLDPARFGMGFCRIHRSVFELMMNASDDAGVPRIGQFLHKGELVADFFPNGPGLDNTWFGEDTGFFHVCRLLGITPRIEQRTKLIHVGRKAFPYIGPGFDIQTGRVSI